MSRSGYSDDINNWQLICWRGAVLSATRGKRGQSFFKELLVSLDEMAIKKLIADELEFKGEFCTLGVLGHSRGIEMDKIDVTDPYEVSRVFNIARALAQEVVFMNDDNGIYLNETPEDRWSRMHQWITEQIIV